MAQVEWKKNKIFNTCILKIFTKSNGSSESSSKKTLTDYSNREQRKNIYNKIISLTCHVVLISIVCLKII
jgi:hypothetical protein